MPLMGDVTLCGDNALRGGSAHFDFRTESEIDMMPIAECR